MRKKDLIPSTEYDISSVAFGVQFRSTENYTSTTNYNISTQSEISDAADYGIAIPVAEKSQYRKLYLFLPHGKMGYNIVSEIPIIEFSKLVKEMHEMQVDEKLDRMESSISAISTSIGKLEVNVEYMKNDIEKIDRKTEDIHTIPVLEDKIDTINKNIEDIKTRQLWWKQYILVPIITGAILLGLECLFRLI